VRTTRSTSGVVCTEVMDARRSPPGRGRHTQFSVGVRR
jgi:hypothetical protein